MLRRALALALLALRGDAAATAAGAPDALRTTGWGAQAARDGGKELLMGGAGDLYWRKKPLYRVKYLCANGTSPACEGRDIYQFGVYTGRSMRAIRLFAKLNRLPFRKIWGFDSFQGLPAEPAELG